MEGGNITYNDHFRTKYYVNKIMEIIVNEIVHFISEFHKLVIIITCIYVFRVLMFEAKAKEEKEKPKHPPPKKTKADLP